MTRGAYFLYVAERAALSVAVATAAALGIESLQRIGVISCPGAGRHLPPLLGHAAWWAWPALSGLLAHVVLGPKQRVPVYLKVPGAMYRYAGVTVSRSAGCRGGLVTGSTGSGKTLCCILPRLHSLCINEAGIEDSTWRLREPERAAAYDAARHRQSGPGGAARLKEAADAVRTARYIVPPWGGLIIGEKGNEWRSVGSLLECHGRTEDLCVLGTGQSGPRINLLGMASIPADTYAQMLVDAAAAVERHATRDEFFVPQARDKIAWGLRLCRAAARAKGPPTIPLLLDLLSVRGSYAAYVSAALAAAPELAADPDLSEARYQLENNYWTQPPEQLGGVRSTIHNVLAPYCEPEVARVFCADSTFDLRDIEAGKVICLALPQRLSLQRRYVATLLKELVYHIVRERFDSDAPAHRRNVIVVEQDEWQRHAVPADCDVDIVREAQGAVYAATQSQNAVWARLGGREEAAPLIGNLRNLWICQASTDECAQQSSQALSERWAREITRASGPTGPSTTVTHREQPVLHKARLRALAPFHVVFAPAEGPWLYRLGIAMPATPDGRIPAWWFGDWNPWHWVSLGLLGGSRRSAAAAYVPPWRARAPLRAMIRWLIGLDGTFILLEAVRARDTGSKRPE
jgi:hypothetical protein